MLAAQNNPKFQVYRPLANIEILRYTRKEIDEAGEEIRGGLFVPETPVPTVLAKLAGWDSEKHTKVRDILNNWRAAHNFTMERVQGLLKQIVIDENLSSIIDIPIARLKRFPTIVDKLQRSKIKMRLTRMQDIGGCRVVFQSIEDVNKLITLIRNHIGDNVRTKESPYIDNPKEETGYRSHHLIYDFEYEGPEKQLKAICGLRTEVQIRTKLQHNWATAVEIVDIIKKMSLKTGYGSPEWERFFLLMSSFIARKEKLPDVPNVPEDFNELRKEISFLNEELAIEQSLNFAPKVLKSLSEDKENDDVILYIVSISKGTNVVTAAPYKSEEIDQAISNYYDEETRYRDIHNTVLISASSLKQIRTLYSNYTLDASEFYKIVLEAIF